MALGLSLIFGSGAVVAAPACLPQFQQGWIRAAPPGTTALAAYGRLRNTCPKAFVLKDVASKDFAMAMVHETRVEKGLSQMRAADELSIPARGQLDFAPGGRHIMLMHPVRELKVGDKVWLEITLAGGTRIRARFEVRREAPAATKR